MSSFEACLGLTSRSYLEWIRICLYYNIADNTNICYWNTLIRLSQSKAWNECKRLLSVVTGK